MTLFEFNDKIEKQIRGLSDSRRLKFACEICNRLYPEYETFSEKHNWGNPEFLKIGIKYCERILDGDKSNNDQIERIKKSIENVIPDTNDFGNWDGSSALDACVAIIEILEFILDKKFEHVFTVSIQMTDTVDFKISETFGELSDKEIDIHPWMAKERNNQLGLTR